jgi:hypothetical protein
MVVNAPGRIHFNTDALPERDRFPAFCEEAFRCCTVLDVVVRDETPFCSSVELQRVGEVDIALIATTPADYMQTPALVHDGDHALCIVLCRSGGRQTARLRSGAGARDYRPTTNG